MLGQPGLELAFGLHLFLQGTQGRQAGADAAQQGALGIGFLLASAALRFQRRHLVLQFVQAGLGHCIGLFSRGRPAAQLGQTRQFGRGQRAALGLQSLAPQAQAAALLLDMAAVGGQQLNLLLHRRGLAALAVGRGLRRTQLVLDIGLLRGLLFGLRGQQLGLLLRGGDALGQAVLLGQCVVAALLPLAALGQQLGHALLHPLAAVDHIADALFEPAHRQRGLGQGALGAVQLVAGGIVVLAHGFECGLDMAQFGQPCFQGIGGLTRGLGHPRFFGGGVALLEKPQLVQLGAAGRLQRVVAAGHLGLLLQLLKLAAQLTQDVVDAGQVFARVLEPVLGLAAPLFVFADAGGFLQEQPQFLGP